MFRYVCHWCWKTMFFPDNATTSATIPATICFCAGLKRKSSHEKLSQLPSGAFTEVCLSAFAPAIGFAHQKSISDLLIDLICTPWNVSAKPTELGGEGFSSGLPSQVNKQGNKPITSYSLTKCECLLLLLVCRPLSERQTVPLGRWHVDASNNTCVRVVPAFAWLTSDYA